MPGPAVALKRVWIPSPNYSSRGSGVRLVVVHTAEGARTYQDLGNFFASSSAGVSSHTGIDDNTGGKIGEYVKRGNKAWTQANANPYSVATELCGFAEWSESTWRNQHDQMLRTCAAWIREECQHYGLPIVKLSAGQAQGSGHGVCGHVDLGAAGGGHWDPGPGFPWGYVIDLAKSGGQPKPPKSRIPPLAVRVVAHDLGDTMPDYLITDDSKSDGAGNHYACFASGLVRQVRGPEWQRLRDSDLPILTVTDNEAGNQLLNYDRCLRGQVTERK